MDVETEEVETGEPGPGTMNTESDDDILELMEQTLEEELAADLASTDLGNGQDPDHEEPMGDAPEVDGHQEEQDIPDELMTEAPFTETGPIHIQPIPNTPPIPNYNPTNTTTAIHTPTSTSNFTSNIGILSQTTIAPPSNPYMGNEELVFEAPGPIFEEPMVASSSDMEDTPMGEDPSVETSRNKAPPVQVRPQAPAFSSIPKAWLLPSKPREAAKLDLSALKKTLEGNIEERSKGSIMGRGGKQRAFDQAAVKGALLPDTYYTIGAEGLPHKETDGLPFTESDDERLSATMEKLDTASKHNRDEQNKKNILVVEAEEKLKEGWQKKKNDADFQSLMKLKKRPANPFIVPKRPKKPADKQ
ncbi:hypothetical protein F4813DRAFT_393349 [Daldinia decipiens]|uniref:uncharacterized protein n=1 Tax=Daldinia decipiens TaxID=326647 RepID=UPI0020C3B416|nr:uncharacterized protein F4813DRAFT_393349 [Daldinia decipiens]KAI1653764.1 hypothetical protein F4813DRAFT_393349 [Daldinia decipiens]